MQIHQNFLFIVIITVKRTEYYENGKYGGATSGQTKFLLAMVSSYPVNKIYFGLPPSILFIFFKSHMHWVHVTYKVFAKSLICFTLFDVQTTL